MGKHKIQPCDVLTIFKPTHLIILPAAVAPASAARLHLRILPLLLLFVLASVLPVLVAALLLVLLFLLLLLLVAVVVAVVWLICCRVFMLNPGHYERTWRVLANTILYTIKSMSCKNFDEYRKY